MTEMLQQIEDIYNRVILWSLIIYFSRYICKCFALGSDSGQIIMNALFHKFHFGIDIEVAEKGRDEDAGITENSEISGIFAKIPSIFFHLPQLIIWEWWMKNMKKIIFIFEVWPTRWYL